MELHIEHLVLQGFTSGDRYRIAEALEVEMHRLLAERGLPTWLPQRGGEMEQVDGGTFTIRPGAEARSIGAQVAAALYQGGER